MGVVRILLTFLVVISCGTVACAGELVTGTLDTSDCISISFEQRKNGHDSVIIVCPGFYNSKSNRWMRKAVELVAQDYDTIIFDFRGHGKSGGLYTWSAKEYRDVDAAVNYAVSQGYRRIGILAFSLGAASAVLDAASRDDITSMVLISCPSSFDHIDFCFWERGMLSDLMDNISTKWADKGAKTTSIFLPKESPLDAITRITRTPIFFIHGDQDWVVKSRHSRKLFDAAPVPKKLEIVKGGLHAERLIEFRYDEMRKLILDWFAETMK